MITKPPVILSEAKDPDKYHRIFIVLITLALVWVLPVVTYADESDCQRIVSLAPSATEVAVVLGLGAKVVGVSSYDTLKEVSGAARIGGLFDASLERIVLLRPSLVLALPEHAGLVEKLEHIPSKPKILTLDHQTLSGIDQSISTVGELCGLGSLAKNITVDLFERKRRIKSAVTGLVVLRVLVVVGRGASGDLFISGKDGYYHDLLKLAGAESVYDGSTISFPNLGPEGIMLLKPDAIIEVVGEIPGTEPTDSEVKEFWAQYPDVPAVKAGKIFILRENAAIVPGPSYIALAERLAKLLHPETYVSSAHW